MLHSPLLVIELVKTPGRKKAASKKPIHKEGETESISQPPEKGVFDRLKKVVEYLGIRVVQTVGMGRR